MTNLDILQKSERLLAKTHADQVPNWTTQDKIDAYNHIAALSNEVRRLRGYERATQEAQLPCDVKLLPGMEISKGCSVYTLLRALNRRAQLQPRYAQGWNTDALQALLGSSKR